MKNAKGSVYYGMHFYPGVAQYDEPGKEPFRVFLNEDTLRKMDASFAGRPIFVMHVDEVEADIDLLRKEADGWVVESFYNEADGKHWVKMLICSDKGERAIKQGMKLSNCYVPKQFGSGGLWNGVPYDKQVEGGEYEHLAIVPNPRYEESIVLTPEEFRDYNNAKKLELSKIANQGDTMKLTFFKRAKVENALDLEETMVQLPKSKREISIAQLVNEADEHEKKKEEPQMANDDHQVEVGDKKMKVSELKDAYNALVEKHKNDDADMENAEDKEEPKDVENSEDDEAKKDAEKLVAHEEKEIEEAKKKNALEKAKKLANANKKMYENEPDVTFDPFDKVNRGKARYGN